MEKLSHAQPLGEKRWYESKHERLAGVTAAFR